MKFNNDDVAKQIEQALENLNSNKIDIHKKLVKNSSDNSLYEYLKNIIENKLGLKNIYDIWHAIYFENDLLKGVYLFGEFAIRFDAKDFSNFFDSNNLIRIKKDNYDNEKIIMPASKNEDYIVKGIQPTNDKQDKTISYAYSDGKIYQELSFDIKRSYMDYSVNKINYQSLPDDNRTNIFVDNHYYCTSEFGGITNCDNGVLERIKTLHEVNKSSFHYNEDEEKLKKEIIQFSLPLTETFNNIEKRIKEGVKQYPIRIVDYNEIKFSDEEEKKKTK